MDICFGEVECGMLRIVLRKRNDGVIESYRGLDLGHIAPDNFIEFRRQWIDEYFSAYSKHKREKILKEEIARFNTIMSAARNGEVLRVWCGSAPYSKCGFYHLIYSLQGIECPILVVEMPARLMNYKAESADSSWGQMESHLLERGVLLQRELLDEERKDIAMKWDKLAKENSNLRVNVNGELSSVPDDYLDAEIMSYAPEGEFKIGKLIGTMLGKSKHHVFDCFVERRIDALIQKNELTVVREAKNPDDYYKSTILYRTNG